MNKTKAITARIASAVIALALILTCVPQATAYAGTVEGGKYKENDELEKAHRASTLYKPNPVKSVKVTKKNPHSLTVKYSASKKTKEYSVKGALNYEIRVYKGSKLTGKALTPKTSVTVNGLSANTKYTVKVRAVNYMTGAPAVSKWAAATAKTAKEKKSHKHSYKTNYSYKPVYKRIDVSGNGGITSYEYEAYKASKGKWTVEQWMVHTNLAKNGFENARECNEFEYGMAASDHQNELDEYGKRTYYTLNGVKYCRHTYEEKILPRYEYYKKHAASVSFSKYLGLNTSMISRRGYDVITSLKKAKDGMVCSCGAVK